MRTPENILMHELIGLDCRVMSSASRMQDGMNGRIADETMKNIVLETSNGMKTVPKKGAVFSVKIGACNVGILGDAIIARPEDRIKKKFRKW